MHFRYHRNERLKNKRRILVTLGMITVLWYSSTREGERKSISSTHSIWDLFFLLSILFISFFFRISHTHNTKRIRQMLKTCCHVLCGFSQDLHENSRNAEFPMSQKSTAAQNGAADMKCHRSLKYVPIYKINTFHFVCHTQAPTHERVEGKWHRKTTNRKFIKNHFFSFTNFSFPHC